MKKRKIGLGVLIAVLLILIVTFSTLVEFVSNYLWFKEMGYTSVFFTQLFTQLKIGIPSFIILGLLAFMYLFAFKRGYYKKVSIIDNPEVKEKTVNGATVLIALLFSGLVTISAVTNLWFQALKFTNSTDFSLKDPIFNNDVSFYVFKLEFFQQITQIAMFIVIGFALISILYYFILLSLRKPKVKEKGPEPQYFDEGGEAKSGLGGNTNGSFGNFAGVFGNLFGQNFNAQKPNIPQMNDQNFKEIMHVAFKQILSLGVIFFLLVAVNFFLKQFSLLYSRTGVLYGASFTDVNVNLWVYRALAVLAVIAAVMFVVGMTKKKYKQILVVPVIMILVGAIGTGAALAVQNLIVSPDEINKESQYLENNIKFTQAAYDLQSVQVKPFKASSDLTKQDIANNMDTISNIRINDYVPAKKFYINTQSIKRYYTFKDVDVDRYMINGELTQTFLAAREMNEAETSEQWLSMHLKYTHGYGIALSRVDKVTASGQPDMLISNIPPVSQIPEIKIDRPEIYFGEMTQTYILTNTDEQEFDYPSSEGNVYSTYEGAAGIKMSLLNKIIFAIKEQSLKLLVSTNIDENSKIIINRNIMERSQKIMPYLTYDQDPYVITADGKLYWIIDAYTTSNTFPYSEPYAPNESSVNYIRNSVKIVIDAYNGTTDYYLVDDNDPIALTYAKIYPKLFKNMDQMPDSIKAHIRYPGVMLNIQADVYKRYHMNDVRMLYQNEDLWSISKEIYGTEEITMTPNYYVMKLPGEDKVEFINSIPYTPRGKLNMTGLLVARSDVPNYGELILYQMPKDKNIYGPMQMEAQIDQHPEISKEFSLWNSSGSTYSRGNMFIIPIEDSLIYVEPVYLEASNSSLPEVKRVIVAYGDRIAYEPTLTAALDSLFGTGSSTLSDSGQTADEDTKNQKIGQAEIIALTNEAFKNANAAQRSGDWAAYGNYLKQLEKYLNMLTPDASETGKPSGKSNEANTEAPKDGGSANVEDTKGENL